MPVHFRTMYAAPGSITPSCARPSRFLSFHTHLPRVSATATSVSEESAATSEPSNLRFSFRLPYPRRRCRVAPPVSATVFYGRQGTTSPAVRLLDQGVADILMLLPRQRLRSPSRPNRDGAPSVLAADGGLRSPRIRHASSHPISRYCQNYIMPGAGTNMGRREFLTGDFAKASERFIIDVRMFAAVSPICGTSALPIRWCWRYQCLIEPPSARRQTPAWFTHPYGPDARSLAIRRRFTLYPSDLRGTQTR